MLIFFLALVQFVTAIPTWHDASDGNSYLIATYQKYNWLQAADMCARQDLQLVVIDNAQKNAAFDALLRKLFEQSPNLWLGHHDEFSKDINVARPFYAISTGEKINFDNWAPGEPNNKGATEHCVHIHSPKDFKWNDVDCKGKYYGYICEKHHLTTKYNKDLAEKRVQTYQTNDKLYSNFKDTNSGIYTVLRDSHSSTNDLLLNFDRTMDEIISTARESWLEIVKKNPYLEAVIADLGNVVREILQTALEDISSASQDTRNSIQQLNEETQNVVNDKLNIFASVLEENADEIDNILK